LLLNDARPACGPIFHDRARAAKSHDGTRPLQFALDSRDQEAEYDLW